MNLPRFPSQITFENCTTNFYFENDEFGVKATIANYQPISARNVSACLHILCSPILKKNVFFMKLAILFISTTRCIFTKLLDVSESSIKIKVRSDQTLFVILLTLAVICKQRLLDRNEIVQYLHNSKLITLAKIILESLYKVLQDL